ncbi:SMI1/KNR4 family protein [Pseudomonas syringae USA007]|uniref:SMI1/KNR4 family protein n=1 Tax=Pseudomonas syringae USA007 TaxID=1357288 RepID=A0AAU8M8Q0_PSESX|nr:SMI1/KNR4 family protein [Pseudomonas syringae]
MINFTLSKSDSTISDTELKYLESIVGRALPEAFKQFYIKHNGGVPNKDWWDSGDEYEPMRIKKFKSVAYEKSVDAAETKFLGGCYISMTEKKVIPKTLLPFATDDGGNFFCLDLADGNICFYATDSFDPEKSIAVNQSEACRWLAKSFEVFIRDLKDETEIDF